MSVNANITQILLGGFAKSVKRKNQDSELVNQTF